MSRCIAFAAAALLAFAAALPAQAQNQGAYEANFAIALKGGIWDPGVSGADSSGGYGIEVSVDDPLLRPIAGKLRHMLSFNHADLDGLKLSTAEWNAHWVFEPRRDFWIGAGPGIGYLWADGRSVSDGMGVQFGASATYVHEHALLGMESRYQWVDGSGADNWLTMVKLGYRF